MRVLDHWLKEFIRFSYSPEVLAEKLSMLGLEIEGIEHLGEKLKGFIVGEVIEKERHPNADRLSVCKVNVGKAVLQVVCGAPNVAASQKVAVGLVGATVPRNQHDPSGKPFVLGEVKIRGVESFGMICSEYELDLGKDSEGILVLDASARVGQSLAKYFGLDDVAYDVEITANRPDLLSHFGIAREIGVLVGRKPKPHTLKLKQSRTPIQKHLKVKVDDKADCPRFCARVIRGVKIGPSPQWIQNRLTAVGLHPRNVVVDVTNYVMLEYGQPLHAFDHGLLRGGMLRVRRAGASTAFRTLDGKEYTLPQDAVMVCDAEKEVAIAGIMGGQNSEINNTTTDIVLEAAHWNPSSIRRTRRKLGISTDASQRFERGTDPNMPPYALERAAALILEYAGGEVLRGLIDVNSLKRTEKRVPLRPRRVNGILGTTLKQPQVVKYLEALGIKKVGGKKDSLVFSVPSFRVDIEREVDLVEEVARVHGYNNIPVSTTAKIDIEQPFPSAVGSEKIREALIAFGYHEAVTVSMHSASVARITSSQPVLVKNPQNQEMNAMRTSMIPGLLEVIALNQNFGNRDLRLFEIGHVFSQDNSQQKKLVENFLEEERVGIALCGLAERQHWSDLDNTSTLFRLKGDIEDLMGKIILDKGRLISYSTTETLAEDTLAIEINGSYAGYLGRVRGETLKAFGIEQDVFIAELKASFFHRLGVTKYKSLPRFPKVRRDVALAVDEALSAESVLNEIRNAGSDLLKSVELFDVYSGKNMPSGKKSLAFTVELLSGERTLTESEIEGEVSRIVRAVETKFGALLRTLSE
ncbi:MAG: phenylalanine--tRNA ligase subunit beta [Bacteroidota bacterium]